MALQIILNLLIAVIWIFLQNSYTFADFLIGYVIGILVLIILRRFLEFNFYLKRIWAIIKLLGLFLVELIKANIDVLLIVLKPKLDIQPGIVACPTKLETELEVAILAVLISLTPGTVSMEFSDDGKTIFIHSIDVDNKEEMIQDIHASFEKAILEVTK